jgi:hypothetical protein
VGRRHLIRSAAIAAALSVTIAAPAGAAIRWKTVSDGFASGPPLTSATGYVAFGKTAASSRFAERLTPAAKARLGTIDFSKNTLVAIFGEFGCEDPLIAVTSVVQHGKTLAVGLVHERPSSSLVECMAIYATYRFLTVPLTALAKPYPTHVTVTVAPA